MNSLAVQDSEEHAGDAGGEQSSANRGAEKVQDESLDEQPAQGSEQHVPRYPSSSRTLSRGPSSSSTTTSSTSSSLAPAVNGTLSSTSDTAHDQSSSPLSRIVISDFGHSQRNSVDSTRSSGLTETGRMSPRRLSMMGQRSGGRGHQRTSSDSFGELLSDEVDMAARGSPTRRRSAGKLVTFIDKLKPSRHSSGGGGGAGGIGMYASHSGGSDGEATHMEAKSGKSSRLGSGKHTPSKDASGDYGHFLKAAELQERLENEQEKAAQRELKLAKQKKGKPSTLMSSRAPLSTRPSDLSASAAGSVPAPLPLEETKQFPGGLDGIFEDNGESSKRPHGHHHHHHHHHHHSNIQRRPSNRSSAHTSPVQEKGAAGTRTPVSKSPFFLGCGQPIESEDEGENIEDEDNEATAVGDGSSPPSLKRSSSHSSFSSTGSYGEDTVTDLSRDPPRQWKGKSASTVSLKSWQSNDSGGRASLASGGANPKLQGPLLELEELELRSFLKNFNRHTREVRVPASLHFPRRRMPQWEDFKIPPGEKELAARQGKRVTVLTHVDRGLQALANEEGQGAPMPRSGSCGTGLADGKKAKRMSKSGSKGDTGTLTATTTATSTSSQQPDSASKPKSRVTWHPDTGFVPEGLAPQLEEGGGEDFSRIGRGFGNRADPYEKDERKAKQLDAQRVRQQSGGGILNSDPDNVHDSQTELRPSRDEVGLTEGTWELINADAEHEAELDPTEGDRVDGVAFCIAYILALVERYAPDELDNTPDQTYREGRARSHLERLYIIAPFWERLLFGLRRLYRWDNPRRTSTAAMIYFVLWWTDLLPTAFFLTLIYYILQFRFFPPDVSYLHEQVRNRMARGVEADKLAERLRRRSRLDVLDIYKRFTAKYGVAVQLAAGDIADFHEKVKNLILWRNPPATWRTLTLFGIATVIVTFAPAYYIWKFVLFFIGFTFFCLLPLQSHYPRYRRPLSPFWWALWSVPSDRQFAIQILRRRHLERAQADMATNVAKKGNTQGTGGEAGTGASGSKKSPKKRSEAAHAVKGGSMKPVTGEEQKLFGLEEEIETGSDGQKRFKPKKLGSFFCQHHGVPGHVTVTTREVYFRGLGGSKSCKTPLEEIAGLAKTKSLQLFVWSSSGLQVTRVNKRSLFFSNMVKRDEAFNLILAVGSEVWSNN